MEKFQVKRLNSAFTVAVSLFLDELLKTVAALNNHNCAYQRSWQISWIWDQASCTCFHI